MKNIAIPSSIRLFLTGALVALITLSVWAETKTDQQNKKDTQAKSDEIEVPRSEFVLPAKAGEGRDPFFPLSRRLVLDSRPAQTNSAPKAVSVSLTLNGISGTESKRYALINGKTFVVGDQMDVPVGEGRVRVQCIEIREDSAVVEANGSRQELRLKPGI